MACAAATVQMETARACMSGCHLGEEGVEAEFAVAVHECAERARPCARRRLELAHCDRPLAARWDRRHGDCQVTGGPALLEGGLVHPHLRERSPARGRAENDQFCKVSKPQMLPRRWPAFKRSKAERPLHCADRPGPGTGKAAMEVGIFLAGGAKANARAAR
jgi:hypothetical protein